MNLSTADGDPEALVWIDHKRIKTLLGFFQPGRGFVQDKNLCSDEIFSGRAPNDEEFESILMRAKALSLTEPRDSKPKVSVFIMLRHVTLRKDGSKAGEKCFPIAEYLNGELEAYCRPPWRRGHGLD